LVLAQTLSAHPVPLLSIAYKFSVSFYKTSITGDNHTIGRPSPQFFQPFDHNWGTFALNTSLPIIYIRTAACQYSHSEVLHPLAGKAGADMM